MTSLTILNQHGQWLLMAGRCGKEIQVGHYATRPEAATAFKEQLLTIAAQGHSDHLFGVEKD
jgi:hypothetical protein